MNALVYSSSLVAAFLGGVLALFAPCCIVSLLPTFVATAIERGRAQLPVTALLFAAGVAAVLLPIVLGIGALGQLFAAHHRELFLVVGIFLSLLGLAILTGRHWALPMPALRFRAGGTGASPVVLLGVVSGLASSCCAPVVAGVVAMSALASSIVGALGLGLSYVFGMVFPLFLATLLWDRLPARARRLTGGMTPLRFRGFAPSLSELIAGIMFLAIGVMALVLSFTGAMSYSPDWLNAWNGWATARAGDLAAALRTLPTPIQAGLLFLMALSVGLPLLGAWRSRRWLS